jgi:L-ribulose-5-phosphate 4-epimerase
MHEELKESTCRANVELAAGKLVICSWGNVSGIDRAAGAIAIKPSGVPYDQLTPEMMVLLDLDGNIIEGDLKPSSDTPTHIELYRSFEAIGGVCHTHSTYATMWAQACREIPCFGTTHADFFYGPVPVTDSMTQTEIEQDYELNTGKVIVRRFGGMNALETPGVLVANHGPFTWGKDPQSAVEGAVVLEQLAKMALGTVQINPKQAPIDQPLLDKHYLRKHGKNAYYGQK